jgi:sigma-B regulation protein RsbU (phosphoserine phosphatase)
MIAAPEHALLIVDDDENNRYTLEQRLKRLGYVNIATAVNGREAFEALRERSFDLVLLDVMMPEMNGYQLLEAIRADKRLRHIPVIMISAVDQIESVVRCIELGAEDYLPKPFNPILLRARVGASLEKKRLRDEIDSHLARVERELGSAREIQLAMVPTEFPQPTPEAPVEIFAALHPAREVGGDFYDFFYSDPQTLCLVIADVSDKGAPAALFMARTKTLIRTLASLMSREGVPRPEPHDVLARANEELCRENRHSMFVTVFLAMLDLRTSELRFCNAGHPTPYVLGEAGIAFLDDSRGKPLGIRRTFAYTSSLRQLAAGECLFLFTDGVIEAFGTDDELFSEARLQQALRSVMDASAERVVGSVIGAVRRFAGRAPQSDDIAALALRRV